MSFFYGSHSRKNVRWKDHLLTLLQPSPDEPHLVIEALHPIFASQNTLCVLIVYDLCVAYLAYKGLSSKVHQFVDFEWGIGRFALGAYVSFVVEFLDTQVSHECHGKNAKGAYIPKGGVNFMSHFRYPPLYNIAEMLVVEVVVLSSDSALRTLFELILSVASHGRGWSSAKPPTKRKMLSRHAIQQDTNIFTKESFDSTAMTLFSSLGWRPILPARSSSLRLRTATNHQV